MGNGGVSKGGKRRGEEEEEDVGVGELECNKAHPIFEARQCLQAMEGWEKEAIREGEEKGGVGTSVMVLCN